MIRIIGNRIMMAKGDTGMFSIPNLYQRDEDNIAVFTVYDKLYKTKVIEKITDAKDEFLSFILTSRDTEELEPRTYYWDITVYYQPEYDDEDFPIRARRVDSYYGSRLKLPKFIVKGGI